MLVLHALYSGHVNRLVHWMEICPRKQFTTLDTHDGIGVVDVKDLLTDEETEETREALCKGANVKKIYSTEAYNNLDIYQINCTYYSALGNNDQAYLLARVLQCFAPGIPQIYYVGLLAGENDIELLESSKEGRNINRHYYDLEEIEQCNGQLYNPCSNSLNSAIQVQLSTESSLLRCWMKQVWKFSGIIKMQGVCPSNSKPKRKSFEIVEIEEGKITIIEL